MKLPGIAFDKGSKSSYKHAGFKVDDNPYKYGTKKWKEWELGFKTAYNNQYEELYRELHPKLQAHPGPFGGPGYAPKK